MARTAKGQKQTGQKTHPGGVRKSTRQPASKEKQQEVPEKKKKNPDVDVHEEREAVPTKDKDGKLKFDDYPDFRPNLTPKEVFELGSFGGTYFRPIESGVTGEKYQDHWKEFPDDWWENVDVKKHVASSKYDVQVNKYKVKCGTDLSDWEDAGWVSQVDPCGWFQWYCRFFLGRRCTDDDRQLGRAARCFGPTGRWRIQLMNKVGRAGTTYDDPAISPVIRQTLQHWGYQLTEKDFLEHARKKGSKFGFAKKY